MVEPQPGISRCGSSASSEYGRCQCLDRRHPGRSFFWKSPISIDGDGSNGRTSLPCYAPPGYGETLVRLANAGSWENWYGIATNSHGMPYVQGADDPAEGAYVSTTSLQDVSKDIDDPDRYVDSAGVSYLVLPDNFSLGQPLGDIAFAWNILTGDSTNLVHADVGDRNHLKRDLG
jgi:hypothetical protein